jgi:hypothetical protein
MHVPAPARLYRPTEHMEAVALVDPRGHMYPAAQAPLQAEVFSPTTEVLNQVPAGHAVHAGAAARLYWPAGHRAGAVDPAGQAYPAGQAPAHVDNDKPMMSLKVPPAHSTQAAAPAKLYRPAGQMKAVALVDPTGHAYPAVQLPLHKEEFNPTTEGLNQLPPGHTVHTAAADKLYWPAGHRVALMVPAGQAYPAVQLSLQTVARPGTSLHFPASQSVHAAAPLRLYRPAVHIKAVVLSDPARHANPATQTPPHEDVFMPTAVGLNTVPAGHGMHELSTRTSLYLPAGHTVHEPLSSAYPCGQTAFLNHDTLFPPEYTTSTRPSPSTSAACTAVAPLAVVEILLWVQLKGLPPLLRYHAIVSSASLTDSTSTLPSPSTSAATTEEKLGGAAATVAGATTSAIQVTGLPPMFLNHMIPLLAAEDDNTSMSPSPSISAANTHHAFITAVEIVWAVHSV